MALLEVREKLVREQSQDLRVRFYYDSFARASLNLWQHRDSGRIERFQFSYREMFFEKKENGVLQFGRLDEGENPMGIKRSPVMIPQETVDQAALKQAMDYLSRQPMTPELQVVLQLLQQEQQV